MPHTSAEQRPGLGPWRERWDELVLRQPLPSPFQRSWWLEAAAPERTTYLLVTDGEQLVGGLALGVRGSGPATRLTAPGPTVLCPDHLDVLVEPGREAVVGAVVADWFGRPGQRLLDVRGTVASSLLSRAVGGTHAPHDEAPYDVVEPGSDWLAGRSSGFRRNVRRGRTRLESEGYTHRRAEPDRVGAGLAELRRLHEGRPGRGELLAELPRLTRAVEAGARRGEARVDLLTGDRGTIGVVVAFEVAGRLSLYQVARSTEREHGSAGTVLLAAVVEDAVAGGCHEVDLLRGAEDYKGSFADRTRPLERVRAAHGGWATARLAAEDAARRAKRTVSARLRSRAGSDA
ncbi:GNAT family N-acetyltransferase [Nocardioides sp.]|uniref:GNAT family N-acetyltransferase n=1 Tax=Nocardioides sp. TaxID=35761 RepID=UPI0037835594